MSRFWCRWGPAPPKTPLGKKTNPPARMSMFFQTKTTLPHGCQGFPAQSNGTPTQANASKRKQTEVKAGKSQQTQAKASKSKRTHANASKSKQTHANASKSMQKQPMCLSDVADMHVLHVRNRMLGPKCLSDVADMHVRHVRNRMLGLQVDLVTHGIMMVLGRSGPS